MELGLLHSPLCTGPTRRELGSREFWHRLTGPQEVQAPVRNTETTELCNTKSNKMAKGKHKNPTNKNQGYLASSEASSPTTASPG